MIKSYRRRFILSNMILSGTVLLIVFVVLAVMDYRQEYSGLENTMNIILKPWNTSNGSQEMGQPSANGAMPDDRQKNGAQRMESRDQPERRDSQEMRSREQEQRDQRERESEISKSDYELFTTVIYRPDEGEITYLSEGESVDYESISSAVKEIDRSRSQFGTLRKYGLIYYTERTKSEIKIAFIGTDYLAAKVAKGMLRLALIFILSLGAIFAVSVRLARLAGRPLERAIEMERSFVADISHDLKTPITIVLTNNTILKSNKDAKVGDQLQWIESSDAAARNMMTLVSEMLTLSEIETVGKKTQTRSVSLSSSCERCVLELESLAYEQNIEIESDIADGVNVVSTPEYTDRICSGLIENALKYEPAGGRIIVNVFRAKKSAVLTVANKGSVISPEDMEHIFERFYRADKTRGKTKGHGLGLPIIKQMTELIGARIDVESSPGSGTVFTVTFECCDHS